MKNFLAASVLIFACLLVFPVEEEVSPAVDRILMQARDFASRGKPESALECLDKALPGFPGSTFDRYALLNLKFELLTNLSRFDEALGACIEKANIVTSPRQALITAGACLKVKNLELALHWLETSVERGLQTYSAFDDPAFDPLRSNPRFAALAETVRRKNGIGLPARPFTARTVDDREISLRRFSGRVVLIDFWATWCPPCVKQLPELKRIRAAFAGRPFTMIGVAAEADRGKFRDFLLQNAISWPMVDNELGGYDRLAALYGVKNIPATFLIDKKGILRHVNLPEGKLMQALDEMLSE